ncbi:MAG: ribosome-associated translation inhibitor RaiA [Lachnospiraceae bacterium]|nr:ribosome-associated translation inhibitor RaiA [Lachnospiraceae bacterium]
MNYTFTGKNIEVTEALKRMVKEKFGKLEKYFLEDTEIHVTLSVVKTDQKIEVTIPLRNTMIRAEQSSEDMYASIDLIQETIERQLKKYKNKLIDKKQTGGLAEEFVNSNESDENEIKIIKTKKFAVKPMDAEEACLQMELLGHDFFVFRDAYTDEVNVVYKRKDGNYGLIEPEC